MYMVCGHTDIRELRTVCEVFMKKRRTYSVGETTLFLKISRTFLANTHSATSWDVVEGSEEVPFDLSTVPLPMSTDGLWGLLKGKGVRSKFNVLCPSAKFLISDSVADINRIKFTLFIPYVARPLTGLDHPFAQCKAMMMGSAVAWQAWRGAWFQFLVCSL